LEMLKKSKLWENRVETTEGELNPISGAVVVAEKKGGRGGCGGGSPSVGRDRVTGGTNDNVSLAGEGKGKRHD